MSWTRKLVLSLSGLAVFFILVLIVTQLWRWGPFAESFSRRGRCGVATAVRQAGGD